MLLVAILFVPMYLFSTLNPGIQFNVVKSSSFSLSIHLRGGSNATAEANYPLFTASSAKSILNLDNAPFAMQFAKQVCAPQLEQRATKFVYASFGQLRSAAPCRGVLT